MIDLLGASAGQTLLFLLLSTIITVTLKKAGVLNHLYRLKMLVTYTLISCVGNILIPIETWHIVLVGITVVLLTGVLLSLLFYLYVLTRSRNV
ncbi:hypothetical protein HMPREF7545_1704 [Selenomonas noxia ATCC 43541]|nr:hypothetical protein HMPREF7545_1704 [Selenomonas noxia ATCC 43541]